MIYSGRQPTVFLKHIPIEHINQLILDTHIKINGELEKISFILHEHLLKEFHIPVRYLNSSPDYTTEPLKENGIVASLREDYFYINLDLFLEKNSRITTRVSKEELKKSLAGFGPEYMISGEIMIFSLIKFFPNIKNTFFRFIGNPLKTPVKKPKIKKKNSFFNDHIEALKSGDCAATSLIFSSNHSVKPEERNLELYHLTIPGNTSKNS